MQTVRLLVEFDGTDFHGWQFQPGLRTVQGTLQEALRDLCGSVEGLCSSSRTDAGVHARGMPVVFRSELALPMQAYVRGLNGMLPDDVKVIRAAEEKEGFDPRRASVGKAYEYRLWRGDTLSPLERRTSWHVRGALDWEAMQHAASQFVGNFDFDGFRAAQCQSVSSVRDIYVSTWRKESERVWVYRVEGNAFMRNMVRIMVGTLVDIGAGRIPEDALPGIIASRERAKAGRTAPPQGLFLDEVFFS